ncbi:SH3 domain-containing YSC84-like protein 1 [Obelidium mucronatum]|nr:SH3 domain-containing YSC84-like protein 1 [Obelidium mucronatum]
MNSDFSNECIKATQIIDSFRTQHGVIIPEFVLRNARGVAVLSVIKAGLGFSGRHGTGVVVARLQDGSWSAPSAIVTTGLGFGHQIGIESTDFVIILNTAEAVTAFSQGHNFSVGGNLSVAIGPLGASAEANATINSKTVAPIYSYSHSKGLFAGVSLEIGAISERTETNAAAYGPGISAEQILDGFVPRPEYAMELYLALDMTLHPLEDEVDQVLETQQVSLAFAEQEQGQKKGHPQQDDEGFVVLTNIVDGKDGDGKSSASSA